jgi:hypothetical protein
MSELGDELHRLADQGAEQARPLPAAEIIRRGDRRRRRRMVGGTVAGLAVAGAITGGILSGVAGGGPPGRTSRLAIRSRLPPGRRGGRR